MFGRPCITYNFTLFSFQLDTLIILYIYNLGFLSISTCFGPIGPSSGHQMLLSNKQLLASFPRSLSVLGGRWCWICYCYFSFFFFFVHWNIFLVPAISILFLLPFHWQFKISIIDCRIFTEIKCKYERTRKTEEGVTVWCRFSSKPTYYCGINR
jgi:hypothetical protein